MTALAIAAVIVALIAAVAYLIPRMLTFRVNLQQLQRIEEMQDQTQAIEPEANLGHYV